MSGNVWYISVSKKKIEFKKYPSKQKNKKTVKKSNKKSTNSSKKLLINLILASSLIFFLSMVSAAEINDTFHINLQTTFSNGTIETGTFIFAFNITESSDSSCLGPIVYNHSVQKTTDTRGIVSLYLPTTGSNGGNLSALSFDKQYYLCYYRDGTLKDVSQLGRVPYAFRATQVNLSEISVDTDLNMTDYNITDVKYGFFQFLGSLVERITKIFATDVDISNNLDVGGDVNVTGNVSADWFLGNINASDVQNAPWITDYTETDPYWTGNQSSYSTTAEILAFGYYNASDFIITDYFTKSDILGFGYYNLTNFDIADYFTSAEVLAFNYYNASDFDIADYFTSAQILGFNYYNSSDFVISDYYTKLEIDSFDFYNLSDFDIDDYYNITQTQEYGNATYIKQSEEANLNVNSSTWWAGLTGWVSDWFTESSDQLDFNETKLNETIDLRENDTYVNADCPTGQFVQNISGGTTLECTAPAGGGDITGVYGDDIYIYNGSSSGEVTLVLNETVLNETIDTRITSSEGELHVNMSDYWNTGDRGALRNISQIQGSWLTNDLSWINFTDGDTRYILITDEPDLNVNRSEWWRTSEGDLNNVEDILGSWLTNDLAWINFTEGDTKYLLITDEANLNVNASDYWITDEGVKKNVVDVLGSEITNDLGWINQTQGDALYVPLGRTLTAGDGLVGGGNLTADREFAVAFGTDFLGWVNLTDYPEGCPEGQAVRVIGDTLTCIDVENATILEGYPASFFMPLNTSVFGDFNFTGSIDVDGGWTSGGVTIDGGDIYAQTVYVYNISSLEVTYLKINGSLIPDITGSFDLGSSDKRWRDLWISRNVDIGGDLSLTGTITSGTVPWARLSDYPYIIAGTGLEGGGDLSTNRTLSLTNTGVSAGGYGSTTINYPRFTVDAQGRITSAANQTIRSATTSVSGITTLTASVTSTANDSAATPWSVKTAYDLAASKISTETDPYWTANQSSYSTTAEILAFGYYNASDFVITDYFTKTDILGFGYYNLTDFDITDYFTSSEVLAFNYYNLTDFDIADYFTAAQILGFNYYNSTDFVITDYYTKTEIDGFGFYNITDFDINDYYTKTQVYNKTEIDAFSLSHWTDDLGDRGYTHLTNFTDDILWTSGFNATGDTRWLGVGGETDPLWTGNMSTVAFTNIDETFDENLVVTKNLTVDTDTLFVDSNTDMVGIGTSSPSEELEVSGNILASGYLEGSDFRQGILIQKKGRDSWDSDATAWKKIAQTVISGTYGYRDMYGTIFLSEDSTPFDKINFYVHYRSVGNLGIDAPLIRYSLESTSNAASFQTNPPVRVVKTSDTDGGNKTYEIQVRAIDSGWGLAGWDVNYDSGSSIYTHTVYSGFQTAGTPLSSTNIANEGNKYFTHNVLIDGSVGIGTISPQQKLHVNGSAVINGTLNMDSNKIINLDNGTSAQDAVTLSQLQAVNESAVAEETDPLWTGNQSLVYLKSNPFSFVNTTTASDFNYLILSKWANITDAPTTLSFFTDDLGDRGYTHLTNFTDDILWTSGFNATGDTRWLGVGGETDPLWTGNMSTVAFTDIDEIFDENLAVTKNLTVDTDTLFVDSTNNRVGIKDSTPDYELDVVGDAVISGKLGVGSSPYATSQLNIANTVGDFDGTSYYFVRIYPNWAPTTNITNSIYGGLTELNIIDTNSPVGDLTGSYVGGRFRVLNRVTTVNVNKIIGGEFMAWNLGASEAYGNITTAIGGRFDILRSGGTITNAYGMYIEDINEGTNNWAIYSVGGNNYFGGNVGIGTTTPQNTLNVIGDINFTGLIYGNGSQLTGITITETDPLWTGNSTLVPYLASANTFTANNVFNQNLTVDTNTLFVDSNTDRVGIGTTIPTQKLDVRGNVNISGNITMPTTFYIGNGATALGTNALAIGTSAQATSTDATAIGGGANASNLRAIAIGKDSDATQAGTVAIGNAAQAIGGNYAVAIGWQSHATALRTLALGYYANASYIDAIAIGPNTDATQAGATVVGASANANGSASTAFGSSAEAKANSATAIGYGASAKGSQSTALGVNSEATGISSVALGDTAQATADYATALAAYANASHSNSVALGRYATTTAANQFMIGSNSQNLNIQIYGSVGIGTISPQQKLHVNGSAVINGTLNVDSNQINNLANGTSSQDAVTLSQLQAVNESAVAEETDPLWTGNQSSYFTKSDILGFSYYNLTSFDIADYYLKSNPFGFWNDTYATFNKTYADTLYYGLSNPYGYYNSTNPQTETDPLWTGNQSSYWDTSTDLDTVINTDEITELKIDFNTVCGAGNHLYVSGNNLACEADDDTTYSASGTLLNLTGTTFSVNAGTLTSEKGCKFVTGTGIVCDQDYLTSFTETDPLWTGNVTNVAFINKANAFGAFNQTFDTSTLFIDSVSDRVGIGTASPDTKLHIASAAPWIQLEDTSPAQKFRIGVTGNTLYFYDQTDTRTDMVIDTSGNIGIGTTTPSNLLTISDANPTLRIEDTDGIDFHLHLNNSILDMTKGDGTSHLAINLSTGNVGINTTGPRTKTHISGGLGIGGDSNGLSTTEGGRRNIQINTDTNYGGSYDDHTGALLMTTLESGGWGDARLKIALATSWGTYNNATPALTIGQAGSSFAGDLTVGGNDINTTGDMVLNPGGGDVIINLG